MKAIELEKAYSPKTFEDRIYALWKEAGAFKPESARAAGQDACLKAPYVITIPPPNVTGILHLGHGLVASIIDIVIRYHRMKGEPALWVPGTDHAGIATSTLWKKCLKLRGKRVRSWGGKRLSRKRGK